MMVSGYEDGMLLVAHQRCLSLWPRYHSDLELRLSDFTLWRTKFSDPTSPFSIRALPKTFFDSFLC